MNNPVTSVYSTNLFHGTAGLLLAQSSGILLILHYWLQQVHTCNIKQIQFTIKVQRAAGHVCTCVVGEASEGGASEPVWACAKCFSAGICQHVFNG